MTRRLILALLAPLVLVPASAVCFQPGPTFSGTWKQSNDRCVPIRRGDVIRHIEQHGSSLVVETTAVQGSRPSRHAVQRYSIGGPTSVSTGIDGDEFHTSVVRNGASLVFTIEEHEDGRVLHSKETWTLIENETTLEVNRESLDVSADDARKQTLIYLRRAPAN